MESYRVKWQGCLVVARACSFLLLNIWCLPHASWSSSWLLIPLLKVTSSSWRMLMQLTCFHPAHSWFKSKISSYSGHMESFPFSHAVQYYPGVLITQPLMMGHIIQQMFSTWHVWPLSLITKQWILLCKCFTSTLIPWVGTLEKMHLTWCLSSAQHYLLVPCTQMTLEFTPVPLRCIP